MALDAIKQKLGFIVEIEKLKDVYRKTRPVDLERFAKGSEKLWKVY